MFLDIKSLKISKLCKKLKLTLLGVCLLGTMSAFKMTNNNQISKVFDPILTEQGGTTNDIIYSESDVRSDIRSLYRGKDNFKISGSHGMWHSTWNYSQSDLNSSYYNKYKQSVDGTCSTVAATILAEYYSRNIRRGAAFDKLGTFAYTLNRGIKEGIYASYKSGANSRQIYRLNRFALSHNNVYKNHSKRYSDIWDTIKSISYKGPLGFDIPGHSMVCCGYAEYFVSYTVKKSTGWWIWYSEREETVTETVGYLQINNGWYDRYPGSSSTSYFRADKISYNFWSSVFANYNDFCLNVIS